MTLWHAFNDEGPWGRGPKKGSPHSGGPDLEDLLKKGQENFKRMMPGDKKPGRLLGAVALGILGLWLASGFYQVKEGEKGAVLRFGKWVKTTTPGINFRLPYPFEKVEVVKVEQINRLDSGMTLRNGENGDNLMLTGDENIVSVNFTIHWFITDISKYLFKILDPDITVKQAAESAIREVVSQIPLAFTLTKGRGEISDKTRALLQQMLDQYQAGIQIQQVQLKSADPPSQVVDAFRDVQRARADAESKINESKSYYNSVVPVARGEAAKILRGSEGYMEAIVDQAKGETARFLSILKIYKEAPEVTKKRMYFETMQTILSSAPKIVMDGKAQSSQGVMPFLPLPSLIPPAAPKNDEGTSK